MSNEKYSTAIAGLASAAMDGAEMMIASLRKDRDDLSSELEVARKEIASLRAQLATVSVGGVGSLVSVPPECPHLIWYADQDRKPEMFVGHGARDTAMKRFHMISQHWNANLFVRIKKSSRDCPYPVADLAPAPAQPVTWPGNAAEVREFMDAHCQREERANDDSSPSDDDLYALTAYNFLSAVNSWADSPHHPGATQPAAQEGDAA